MQPVNLVFGWGILIGAVLPILAIFVWRRASNNYEMVTQWEFISLIVIGTTGFLPMILSWTALAVLGAAMGLVIENTFLLLLTLI